MLTVGHAEEPEIGLRGSGVRTRKLPVNFILAISAIAQHNMPERSRRSVAGLPS
jgi:hypothetical protein